jgi:hypothetical protein
VIYVQGWQRVWRTYVAPSLRLVCVTKLGGGLNGARDCT